MKNETSVKRFFLKNEVLKEGLNRTLVSKAAALSLVCGLTAAWVPLASADITFEDRGERFSLDVRDEPIADVMDKLSERFDFDVDGYPEHWSDDPMSFSATGDLERVLRSLLKDTSHVFEYHTDLETRKTRIAGLKLLNEGVEGFVPTQQGNNSSPDSPVAGSKASVSSVYGTKRSAGAATSATRDGLAGDLPGADPNSGAAQGNGPTGGPVVAARTSGLSQSLEARARQASGTAPEAPSGTAGVTPNAGTSPNSGNPATNISEADMQALTQRALQDVKGLAEALRKAEGK